MKKTSNDIRSIVLKSGRTASLLLCNFVSWYKFANGEKSDMMAAYTILTKNKGHHMGNQSQTVFISTQVRAYAYVCAFREFGTNLGTPPRKWLLPIPGYQRYSDFTRARTRAHTHAHRWSLHTMIEFRKMCKYRVQRCSCAYMQTYKHTCACARALTFNTHHVALEFYL